MSLLELFRKKNNKIKILKLKIKNLEKENKILKEQVRFIKAIYYNWSVK